MTAHDVVQPNVCYTANFQHLIRCLCTQIKDEKIPYSTTDTA